MYIFYSLWILLDENPQLWQYLKINPKDASDITEWSSPMKLMEFALLDNIPEKKLELTSNGKQVLNSNELMNEILDYIQNGDIEELCSLCMDMKHISRFTNLCGNIKCSITVCKECMKNWYGSVTLGNVIVKGQLFCPFCKQKPTRSVLKPYNKLLYSIINSDFDEKYVYGWCKSCLRARIVCPKECAGQNPELHGKFECEECEECFNPEPSSILIKECPGCHAKTSKHIGCNHIHCPQF